MKNKKIDENSGLSHDQKLNNFSTRLKVAPKRSGKSQSLPPKRKGKSPRPSRTNG